MAFFHQLRLLLWKNYTLKKRAPFIICLELIVPLIMFLILMSIRNHKPPMKSNEEIWVPEALPSAGIVPLLQSFCQGSYVIDHNGYKTYPNASINLLLADLVDVSNTPVFNALRDLEKLQEHFNTFSKDNHFSKNQRQIQNFNFSNVFEKNEEMKSFLKSNLSMPQNLIDALMNATFNGSEVSQILLERNSEHFDNYIHEIIVDGRQHPDSLKELQQSILFQALFDPSSLTHGPTWLRILVSAGKVPGISTEETDYNKLKQFFIYEYLSKENIRYVCSPDVFNKLIILPSKNVFEKNALQEFLCQLNATRTDALLEEFKISFNWTSLREMIYFNGPTMTEYHQHAIKIQSDLTKVKNLEEAFIKLSKLSRDLRVNLPEVQNRRNQSRPHQVKQNINEIWTVLSPILCGTQIHEKPDSDGTLDGNNFQQIFKGKGDVLKYIYALSNDPMILYAPNGTQADEVIKKAGHLLDLVKTTKAMGHHWLLMSTEFQKTLKNNTMQTFLKNMTKSVDNFPFLYEKYTNTDFDIYKQAPQKVKDFLIRNKDIFNLNSTRSHLKQVLKSLILSDERDNVILQQLQTVDYMAKGWEAVLKPMKLDIFHGFPNETVMLEYISNVSKSKPFLSAIVFDNIMASGKLPKHVIYRIRMDGRIMPSTDAVRSLYWTPGMPTNSMSYMAFAWIQDQLERAMIDVLTGTNVTYPGLYTQKLPYPCYLLDDFMFVVQYIMPLCVVVSFIYSVAILVQSIVYEKEQRLKEVMKMMGLSNAVHWAAWFITSAVTMMVIVILLTVILKIGGILHNSNPAIILLFLSLAAMATTNFCFLMSIFFSKAKLAAACGGIIYFVTYMPFVFISVQEVGPNHKDIGFGFKTLASLLSTTAFGLGARYFALFEQNGVGVQWDNIATSPIPDDHFNLAQVFTMLIVDTLLYATLVWYIEAIHPGTYGIPRPWYFPFQLTYWFGPNIQMNCDLSCLTAYSRVGQSNSSAGIEPPNTPALLAIESEPTHLTLGVFIDNLVKVYKKGSQPAVDHLSLNLYEGQITSFLGHNGAGKTTTMSLLTGLFPSTSGTAYIYGNDIHKDMDKIRRNLGLCPQHNVLYNRLTVEEHMWFYARLKGMPEKQVQEETNRILEDIGLPEKRNNQVDTLSGGMKRKLSVAMAFVGGSRTVILDEPTAGVDPFARRAIWELLAKYKDGRTILLSTHFMDEADILGDRIAIISHGKLRCCGSSLFLKTKFGDGYHLTVVREASQDTSSNVSVETVTEFVKDYIPSAQLVCQSQYEISYILPDKGKEKKGMLKQLFRSLDQNKNKLQCRSFGLQDTTLEEVFLKVTEATVAGEDDAANDLTTAVSIPESTLISSDTSLVNTTFNDSEMPPTNPSLTPPEATLLNNTDMKTLLKTEKKFGHRRSFSTDHVHIKPTKTPKLIMHRRTASGGFTGHRRSLSSDLTFMLTRNDTNSPGTVKKVSKHKRVPSGVATIHSIGSEAWEMHAGGTTTVNDNMKRWQQFYGLLLKRFHHSRRNLKALLTHILLPGIFISIAMTVALSQPKADTYPPLVLSPTMFHPPPYYIPFTNNDRKGDNTLASRMERTLKLVSGIGSDCVIKDSNIILNDFNVKKLHQHLSAYFDDFCMKQINLADRAKLSSIKLFKMNYNLVKTSKNLTCQCVSPKMEYVCDPGIGHKVDMFNVVTMDTLVNVSNQDFIKYLMNTNFLYKSERYGALIFGDQQTAVPTKVKNSSLLEIQKLFVRDTVRAGYSNKGYHALPTFINVMNNAILRAYVTPDANPAAYGITAISHPLNFADNVLNLDSIKQGTDAIIAIFVIIAMSFVPASFVLFLVMERTTKAKHIQFVSGVNPILYWLSNYVWDMLNFMVPAMACMVIFHAFNIPAYASRTNFPAVCALFVCYGWSITPMMYPASFVFREASTAYVVLILLNLFLGITCTVTTAILQLFLDDPQLRLAFEIVKTGSLIFPNYCLGRGLMELAYNELSNMFYSQIRQYDKIRSPFEWDIVLRSLVCMIAEGILFFVITLIIEYKTSIRRKTVTVMEASSDGIDIDVVNEKQRVLSGGAEDDLLRVENLTKIYNSKKTGKHLAVNCLSFGVAKGECFGLLGVNGAGKTTTFKMLTGDTDVTAGNAFIESSSVVRNLLQVHEKIGYCPQFDALIDHLTAAEHIYFYARLKGIPELEIKKVCNWLIKKMALTRYANKPSKTYSGGNKRKLSAAIALIGNPSVIFMDEPTTGMDPGARRFLWNIILSIIHQGTRSVVLTSHSMEECEALCTRLAIMVNGQFQCLGSTQHIKDRFGDGYIVTVRVRGSLPNMDPVLDFMMEKFHDCVLKEAHHNVAQYQIPSSTDISLASIFTKMEVASQELDIEDYSISQTSLDNVFVNFAKYQTDNLLENDPSFICAKKSSKLESLHMKWQQLKSNFARTKPSTSFTQLVQLPPADQFQESNEEDGDEVALHEIDSLSFPEETTRLTFNI